MLRTELKEESLGSMVLEKQLRSMRVSEENDAGAAISYGKVSIVARKL